MMSIAFDTLAYSENLQKAGFTREQADAMAKANAEVMSHIINVKELVTKQDLKIASANIKHEILKWMVTAMIAQTALLVWMFVFFKHSVKIIY